MDEDEATGPSGDVARDGNPAADLSDQSQLASLTYELNRLPGGAVVVVLRGDLDQFTAGLELRELLEQCAAHRDDVVLNLSGVGFIDSMGLSVLNDAHRRLRSVDQALVLMAPPASVLQLLRLTGFDRRLPMVGSPDEAEQLLKRRET